MIRDARDLPSGQVFECDICIVGGGAAGITVATEFVNTALRVLLLESGGFEFEDKIQDLYRGEIIGLGESETDIGRLRYFGGSTNHWNGLCRPLDPSDFEERGWIPGSGWPITAAEMKPFYKRAQHYCQLGRFAYQAEDWNDEPRLELVNDRITMNYFQDRELPTRFGEVYRLPLEASPNVLVWLHASCMEFVILEGGNRVERVNVAGLTGGHFAVQARFYVLATGGIENARLLLLSGGDTGVSVGNRYDLVGRYYADHPGVLQTAQILFNGSLEAVRRFRNHRVDDTTTRRFFGVSVETQRRERIANCGMGMHARNAADGVHSAAYLRNQIFDGEWPDDIITHLARIIADIDDVTEAFYHQVLKNQPPVYMTDFWCETPPLADSRVTLSDDRDALGQRRVVLDWQIPEEFQHTYTRMHEMLAEDIGRSGLGRMQLLMSAEEALADVIASHHHMGTTRMSADPTRGVVDQNCRVHGVENLFVAGSSVFPTYGHANPTLSIVALATRLADHLRQKLDK